MNLRQTLFLEGIKRLLGGGIIKAGTIKGFFAGIIAVFQLTGAILFDTPVTPYGPKIDLTDRELVWSDEFNGTEIDRKIWSNRGDGVRRGGYWDMESQVSVKDGCLYITTEYREDGKFGPGWYTAEVETLNTVEPEYGYLECRCICAPGYGIWSAFWTFSHGVGSIDDTGHDGAEIDVMESPNYYQNAIRRNAITHNVHYDGYAEAHKTAFTGHWNAKNPYTEFNTYGVEWTADELIFYINGVETSRISGDCVPNVKEWLKLSVEVGGDNGIPDKPNGNSILDNPEGKSFKSDFIVDYVRVYKAK